MHILILYDTLHGNTQRIAQVIAESLHPHGDVVLSKLADAGPDDLRHPDLLLVGCPTHAWSMSSPAKLFFQRLAAHRYDGKPAAAFDTKLRSRVAGSAAHRIARALQRLGFRLIADPESFFVRGMKGPLRHGELDHARTFAAHLISRTPQAP